MFHQEQCSDNVIVQVKQGLDHNSLSYGCSYLETLSSCGSKHARGAFAQAPRSNTYIDINMWIVLWDTVRDLYDLL